METRPLRKKKKLLRSADRQQINLVLKKEPSARVYRRALVLKMIDEGFGATQIAALQVACERTVRNVVEKYRHGKLADALYDKQRPGQPRRFTRKQEEQIAAVVCSAPPAGQARWTLSLIKEHSVEKKLVRSISQESIRIMLSSREIKPWKHKMWCMPKVNEEFITRMEDVLKLYEQPLDPNEPVVCMDEKPVQLLESAMPETRAPSAVRQDYEYVRRGVVNAFCAIEPKGGRHFIDIRQRKTARDFALFVRNLIRAYPRAKTIHLVMDNLSTHTEHSLIKTFGKKIARRLWARVSPHYTPKHASWLNQAEIEINMFSKMCLGKNRVPDIQSLRKRAAPWKKRMNKKQICINWAFSRRKARAKFKYKPAKINWSRH